MATDLRAPLIRLLTAPEAADRLGVNPVELERLVDTGALAVLRVSARDGRRFWPADVDAAAAREALDPPSDADPRAVEAQTVEAAEAGAAVDASVASKPPAAVAVAGRQAPVRRRSSPERPRWPGFAFAPHRVRTAYLSFRDPEHVTSYLQARTGRGDR